MSNIEAASLNEELVNNIAVFFYLAMPESSWAAQVAKKCTKKVEKSANKMLFDGDLVLNIIYWTHSIFKSNYWKKTLNWKPEEDWNFSPRVDWNVWRPFAKSQEPEVLESLIWVLVLGFTPQKVAKALNVSEGSVNHRLRQGLLDLSRKTHVEAEIG